jgi:hypothetical protein
MGKSTSRTRQIKLITSPEGYCAGRQSAAHQMTRDKARRIAVNIAKLQDYCRRLTSCAARFT